MTAPTWGGRPARRWTAAVLAHYGTVCHLQMPGCTQLATEGDHLIPRSVRLDLQYRLDNGRPACRSCNAARGNRPLSHLTEVTDRDTSAFFTPSQNVNAPVDIGRSS